MSDLDPTLFEHLYASIARKESTYDGVYYTGVKTTRIVCRPSCRARTPYRENITFYRSLDAALSDGFRPCKRCRPEANGALRPDAALAVQADAWIEAHYGERLTLRELARRLAVSPFHLQRTYKRVTGRSPMEKLHDVRFAAAKRLLTAGSAAYRADGSGDGEMAGTELREEPAGAVAGVPMSVAADRTTALMAADGTATPSGVTASPTAVTAPTVTPGSDAAAGTVLPETIAGASSADVTSGTGASGPGAAAAAGMPATPTVAGQLRIAEIARTVGFQSASHFAMWFKEHAGMSPQDYRELGESRLSEAQAAGSESANRRAESSRSISSGEAISDGETHNGYVTLSDSEIHNGDKTLSGDERMKTGLRVNGDGSQLGGPPGASGND
ncbi:Ada metal-binding domain-containing protein [Paenibacillus chartarius]|uniref:Ada metal-binding domain-containing protein n=1 Tax=Paenibacillus chartarius TaxID=747481 RepID=A0ABV6DS49_9BACL